MGNPARIHCSLMVFQQGMRYFLALSNAAQSSEILGHSVSSRNCLHHWHNHHYHNHRNWRKLHFHIFHFHFLREVSHESFVFTLSTFTFWGKSRTKALFSHLQFFRFWGSRTKTSFSHLPISVPTTHSGNIWALPCLALACCSSWTSNVRQENIFSAKMVFPNVIVFSSSYRFSKRWLHTLIKECTWARKGKRKTNSKGRERKE